MSSLLPTNSSNQDIAAIKIWGRKAITNFYIGQYDIREILERPLLPIRKGIFSQLANDDLRQLSNENRTNSPADFDYDQPRNNAADEGSSGVVADVVP
ncbi:hypothetical protein LINPERPRIM_LOCUS9022 [Linum perenne]